MNKQRKILIAAMSIAAVAFLADRFILSTPATGPQSASAAAAAPPTTDNINPATDPDAIIRHAQASINTTPNARSVGNRLKHVATAQGLDNAPTLDAFSPPPPWRALLEDIPSNNNTPSRTDPAAHFTQTYKLTSVLRQSADTTTGIITLEGPFPEGENGRIINTSKHLRIGQSVADTGFTLTRITEDTAHFTLNDLAATLKLDRPRLKQ